MIHHPPPILSTSSRASGHAPAGSITTDPAGQREARLLLWLALYRQVENAAEGRRSQRISRLIQCLQREAPIRLQPPRSQKVALIDGRFYWRPSIPGFPSKANTRYWEQYIRHLFTGASAPRHLRLAVTGACPMAGSEQPAGGEEPALGRLIGEIRRHRDQGTSKITLCGGEPMLRRRELPALLQAAGTDVECWMETTGYDLTDDRARQLKAAGLTGLCIDLDYSHAEDCDRCRCYPGAFDWALRAAVAGRRAGLVTCLNFHATRANVSPEHLEQYFDLAGKVGAAFVQLLDPPEPAPAARRLSEGQYDLLEAAALLYNSDPAYAAYPIVDYAGYDRRRRRNLVADLYVDPDGIEDGEAIPASGLKVPEAELVEG